jgi:hypothetical protein
MGSSHTLSRLKAFREHVEDPLVHDERVVNGPLSSDGRPARATGTGSRWGRPPSALASLWGRPPQTAWDAVRTGPGYHWLIPVLLLMVPVLPWYVYRRGYWWLNKEDHLSEWATFAAYIAALVLAVMVGRLLWRSQLRIEAAIYGGLVVFFFGVAGEEISWGQRILGLKGPSTLVDANQQHEMNVHNLLTKYPLEGAYILVGLMGAFGLRWLVPRIPRLRDRPWLFAPPAQLAPWFLAVVVYYGWFDYVDPIVDAVAGRSYTWGSVERLQEVAELSLGCGFLLFVVAVLLRLRAGGLDRPELLDGLD